MNDSVNPQQPGPKQVRNARIKLVALLSVFLLPFIAAIITHSLYRDSGELSTSSYGELILPAVPLTAFSLRDSRTQTPVDLSWLKRHWTLVYLVDDDCAEVCQQNIYHMRQIHAALGKEAHRVQRLAVVRDVPPVIAFIGTEYPNLSVSTGDVDSLAVFSRQLETAVSGLPVQQNSLYLIDPLGNLMMRFPADINPKGILKDIKRALRASRIG